MGKIGTGGKKNKNNGDKYHILVIRIDRNGNLKNSKPCSDCIQFMKTFGGIRNIYYTDSDGILICEKLTDIRSDHNSKGTRAILRDNIL
jgi:hypothetical protein